MPTGSVANTSSTTIPSAALTTLKQHEATAWLNEVSSVPPQQALRHLDKAFKNFFEGRAKYPTFKKKHGRQSAEYTTSAFTWDGKQVTLAKMTEPLPIRWSRPLPEGARAHHHHRDQRSPLDGTSSPSWWKRRSSRCRSRPRTVGIDLGLLDVVTLSTGEKTGNEHFFRKEEKRLARLQRRHAKKRKGSKNREKARRKVARLHARIADRRRDFQHKLTTRLIRENQVVCVESLAVKNLLQNHTWRKLLRMWAGANSSGSSSTKRPGTGDPGGD